MKKKFLTAALIACCSIYSQATFASSSLPTCAEHHQSNWVEQLFYQGQDYRDMFWSSVFGQ